MTPEIALELNKVYLSFKDKIILNNINLKIEKESIFGLIGSSGAGKTSLMRVMIGYYKSSYGDIVIDGKTNIAPKDLKKIFGFCTQENSFYAELTLLENMTYFGEIQDVKKDELNQRCEDLLKMVDLWEYRNYKTQDISGGMKRRFDLALSLIHNPKILILDEPTTGLDSLLRRKIWMIIKIIQSRGVTIILSSHLLDEIDYLCDKVCILKKGEIYGIGSPKQIKRIYSNNNRVSIESTPSNYRKLKDIIERNGIIINNTQIDNGILKFDVKNTDLFLKKINNCIEESDEKLISIKVEQPDLSKVLESIIIEK
jgi:ABC-2 type transport system ATP-binding protein